MKKIIPILAASASMLASQTLNADENPNNTGPFTVISASWLGGAGDNDSVNGVGIAQDGTIFLAGTCQGLSLPGVTPVALDGGSSQLSNFIVHLSGDAQTVLAFSYINQGSVSINKLRMNENDTKAYILGSATSSVTLAGVTGSGTFLALLGSDGKSIQSALFYPNMIDFGVDSNGQVVVQTSLAHLVRFAPGSSTPLWDVSTPSHGSNVPGGMAVSPQTGIAAATGYGTANTGSQPYKDPYCYGFDRNGNPLWILWNPDPTLESSSGGNGLTADTTGNFCSTDDQGNLYFGLFADGGNTILTKDPLNPNQALDPSVLQGVYQGYPGFGFKGASKISAIFRADPNAGRLQKGTFMSSWLSPQQANSLVISAATGVGNYQYAAGDSAYAFTSQSGQTYNPWYQAPTGGYYGRGFLAVFDRGFAMVQAGYFPGTSIQCLDARNDLVVIGGTAGATGGSVSSVDYPVPTYKALQPTFGGGANDGYFVVLQMPQGALTQTPSPSPTGQPPMPTPTESPTETPTPAPTHTPSPTPAPTHMPSPTPTPTRTPTPTPKPTRTPTPTSAPNKTVTPAPGPRLFPTPAPLDDEDYWLFGTVNEIQPIDGPIES